MQRIDCEIAIIGAGTAGLGAFSAAEARGARPVIVESGKGGTTCARIGCMPSKVMIEAGKAAHAQQHAHSLGLSGPPPHVDGHAVMRHIRRERDYFTNDVYEKFDGIPEAQRIRGKARFLSASKLAVDDHTEIEAGTIIIATGSGTAMLPAFEPVKELVLTNDDIFELETLPASLAIVGGGAVGLELAQAFHRLGVRVRLFDKGQALGGLDDPAVIQEAIACLQRELPMALGAELELARDCGGLRASWDDGARDERFDKLLAAAGRPPNLKGLNLEATGLELNEHGVPIFDANTLRCGDSGIFIAGDASAFRPVLHEASYGGRIAGRAAGAGEDKPRQRGTALAVTFSDPQIAIVGKRWAEAETQNLAIGESKFSSNGRARIEGYQRGLIRIYASRADHRLLGGQMVGPGAEHLAHLLAWLIDLDVKPQDATALPFYHPTLEEALRTALRSLCQELGVTAKDRQPCFDAPPGS